MTQPMRTLGDEFRKLGLLSEEDEAPISQKQVTEDLFDDEFDFDDEDEDALDERMSSSARRKLSVAAKKAAKKKGKAGRRRAAKLGVKHRGKSIDGKSASSRKKSRKKRSRMYGMDDDSAEEMDPSAELGRGKAKAGEQTTDRLDSLMGELQSLTHRFQTQEESDELSEDHAMAQRIYANIARVADALSQRIDESDDLFDQFDGLADDALQVAEAIANGNVPDMQSVIDSIPGYVKDLVGAVAQVSEELDAELGDHLDGDDDFDAMAEDDDEEFDFEDDSDAPW